MPKFKDSTIHFSLPSGIELVGFSFASMMILAFVAGICFYFTSVLCCFHSGSLDFGATYESISLSYDEYVAAHGDQHLNPVGASDISYRYVASRDSNDSWWKLSLSKEASLQLVAEVALQNRGPQTIEWGNELGYPKTWKPDRLQPSWWRSHSNAGSQSLSWCYGTGSSGRHHGWFFHYDSKSETLYCWHWNHQWSTEKCSDKNAR